MSENRLASPVLFFVVDWLPPDFGAVGQYELPREALLCGLLDPYVPAEAEPLCITRHRLLDEQRRFNPTAWEGLTEDKSVFYAYCAATCVPVPRLHAVCNQPTGI